MKVCCLMKQTKSWDPLDVSIVSDEQFHDELEKGYADIEKGNVLPAKDAFASLHGELGI